MIEPTVPAAHAFTADAHSKKMSLETGLLADARNGTASPFEPIETRLQATADVLSGWKHSDYERVVEFHIAAAWGTRCTTISRLKMLFSALVTIGSVALNLWFLTNNVMEQRRNEEEDYNLIEYVLLIIEASAVYLSTLFALSYVVGLCSGSLEQRANNLMEFISHFKVVGGFSMLWGLHLLKVGKLYVHITHWVSVNKRFLTSLPDGPLRYFRICYGGCAWMMCFPFTFMFLIFPFLGPAALLLKVRQVGFVSSVYFMKWTRMQWFQFFGFVNNVIKVTASEKVVLEAYHIALFYKKQEDSTQQNQRDEKYNFTKLTKLMISCAVLEKTQSVWKAGIILNSWSDQPETQLAMLRCR